MNLKIKKNLKNIIKDKGYLVLKNISDNKKIRLLDKRSKSKLNNPLYLNIPKKITKNLYPLSDLKAPQNKLEYNLKRKTLKKGPSYYKNFTNSISFKQPLLNFKECFPIVFNEEIINYASIILGGPAKLGYVALTCLMNNNLPKNCINYFHTDDHLNSKIIEKNRLIKLSIPISSKKKIHTEYKHIPINKFEIDNKIYQYSEFQDIPKKLQKKIITPKLNTGDGIFFDPDNFFHMAKKPRKLRIVLYVVYIKKGNYLEKKVKNLKIKRNDYSKLNKKAKQFGELLTKI